MFLFILIIIFVLTPLGISYAFKKSQIKYVILSYPLYYLILFLLSFFIPFEFAFGIGNWGANKTVGETEPDINEFLTFLNQHVNYTFFAFPLIIQLIFNKVILGKIYHNLKS